MSTKRELEIVIGQLQAKLKAVSNELSEFTERNGTTYIPCGKVQRVYGHPWEDQICNAVSDQFDGTTGWIRVNIGRYELPHEDILVNVEYSEQSGTMPGGWCPLAKVPCVFDYVD